MKRVKKKYILILISLIYLIIQAFFSSNTSQNIQKVIVSPVFINEYFQKESSKEQAVITKIIDGDTIEIQGGRKVRYIGVNTPEIHSPKKGVECFGKESAAKNSELLEGKTVYLTRDISEADKYGRLLRNIWLPQTDASPQGVLFVNYYLVREGYAQVSTFPPDVKYVDLLRAAENEARKEKKGLWKECK